MKPSLGKTMLAAATTLVVGSSIAGVILVGSPSEGRFQRLDSGRIEDFKQIMAATDFLLGPQRASPDIPRRTC